MKWFVAYCRAGNTWPLPSKPKPSTSGGRALAWKALPSFLALQSPPHSVTETGPEMATLLQPLKKSCRGTLHLALGLEFLCQASSSVAECEDLENTEKEI